MLDYGDPRPHADCPWRTTFNYDVRGAVERDPEKRGQGKEGRSARGGTREISRRVQDRGLDHQRARLGRRGPDRGEA